jgi:hypothetical protein
MAVARVSLTVKKKEEKPEKKAKQEPKEAPMTPERHAALSALVPQTPRGVVVDSL